MKSYEEVLRLVHSLRPSRSITERQIHWVTDAHVVGVSRTPQNRVEIFLVGERLHARTNTVRQALEHQPWWHSGNVSAAFEANRIVLPAAGHFDNIAALLCTELIRNNVDQYLKVAFEKAEPLIELSIQRLKVSERALRGLVGELLVLNTLCQIGTSDAALQAWHGWQRSLRDFKINNLGVEVKTTTRSSSTHQIQGTHQIEAARGIGHQEQESALYLVSIGLVDATTNDNSFTLPSLVEEISHHLADSDNSSRVREFHDRVRKYGEESGLGYDHRTMSRDLSFSHSYAVRFTRTYDMDDDNLELIRSADVEDKDHIDPTSLSYTIKLPTKLTGDLNPTLGLNQGVISLLESSMHL